MTFGTPWNNLLENIEELPRDATLVTPLSRKAFHLTDVRKPRVYRIQRPMHTSVATTD